jgi:hypothetical protein
MIRYLLSGCLLAALVLAGCRGPVIHEAAAPPPAGPAAAPANAPFAEVAAAAGLRFRHENGGRSPLNILQTAGSGCAFLDYDRDGWLDLFLVNGCFLDGRPAERQPRHALYRNNGDGTFTDVTARAGVGSPSYGMGCAAADYDGDGWPDLYLTNYGPNRLYRNNGDGTFTDVTEKAGVAASGWSTCAAWADADGDGDLDLFVGRYVRFGPGDRPLCSVNGIPVACPPRYYAGQSSLLYRNNGDGTFTDVTEQAGMRNPQGKALGAIWADYDGDGRPDLFVANDDEPNNLYRNLGGGRFRDVALPAGVALGVNGNEEASMGVDFADCDGDGRFDLFVTNFQNETDALYQNGLYGFAYVSAEAGIAGPSLPFLSFGCGFLDYDNDGRLDLVVASGHVQDLIHRVDPACQFAQARQLFRQQGSPGPRNVPHFEEIGAASGPAFTAPAVGRGLCIGDYDNDGGADVLVNNNGGPPMLLRNLVGSRNHWIRLRLEGRRPNTMAVGARVELRCGARRQVAEVRAGGSYCSTHDPRLLFGLGGATGPASATVRWPDGRRTTHPGLPLNRETRLREPE